MSRPLSDLIKLERWRSRLTACIRPVNRCCTAVVGPRVADCVKRNPRASAVRADHDGLNAGWIPRYWCPEEIVSVVTAPERVHGANAGGDWIGGSFDAHRNGWGGLCRPGFGGLSGRFWPRGRLCRGRREQSRKFARGS